MKLKRCVAALTIAMIGACSGEDGERGPIGPQGEPGPRGKRGQQGQLGPAGEVGARGDAGPQGTQGLAGPAGLQTATLTRMGFSLPGTAVYPEGIAADAEGNLFVGSVAQGSIFRLSLVDNSVLMPFDTEGLLGVVGVYAGDGVLWACHSSPTGADVAEIVGFDIVTGDELVRHRFPSIDATLTGRTGFCNDLTIDDAGNLYVTDSFGDGATNPRDERQSRILRVAVEDLLNDDSAEVWLQHSAFVVPGDAFGVNGIDANGSSSIFTVVNAGGILYEIAIDEDGSPGKMTEIVPSEKLDGGDGLRLVDPDTLFVIQQSKLTRVDLANGNAVRVLTGPALQSEFLTTFAVFAGTAWVVEGQLDHLIGMDPAPPLLPFRVLSVPLR